MKETARELFDRAVKAMDEQRWEDCRASFLAALNIHRSYQIAGNLAFCETKLGRLTDAAEHAALSLREMPADAPPDRKAGAEAVFKEVRPKVAELSIRVNRPDAEVFVDGRSVGRSPLAAPVFVEPGDHKIEARLGGATARAALTAKGGGAHETSLTFEEVITPAPQKSLIPVIALGAGAVVAAGIGGGLLGAWSGKRAQVMKTFDDIRSSGSSCVTGAANFDPRCGALESDAHAAESLNRAGIGLFVGAGAIAAGAAAYWLFWPGAVPRQSAVIAPFASPQGAGAVLVGSF